MRLWGGLVVGALLCGLAPMPSWAEVVKLSTGGICHCPGGSHYGRTTNYKAFPSIEACLAVGLPPKTGQGHCQAAGDSSQPSLETRPAPGVQTPSFAGRRPPTYNRDAFGGWADADGDCRDTRAEVLQELSTGPVSMRPGGCVVDRGRWNDPYTGTVFTQASDVDIDHMVPLSWAWANGAWAWDQATRERFANDPVNLFVVDLSANRGKGDADPTEWLPPNAAFQCQYVTRFERIRRTYQLALPLAHQRELDRVRQELCGP